MRNAVRALVGAASDAEVMAALKSAEAIAAERSTSGMELFGASRLGRWEVYDVMLMLERRQRCAAADRLARLLDWMLPGERGIPAARLLAHRGAHAAAVEALETIARDRLRDPEARWRALETMLELGALTEAIGVVGLFLEEAVRDRRFGEAARFCDGVGEGIRHWARVQEGWPGGPGLH